MNNIYTFNQEERSIIETYKKILVIRKSVDNKFKIKKEQKSIILYTPALYNKNTVDAYILKHYKEIAKKGYFCFSRDTKYKLQNDKILYLGKFYSFILDKSLYNKHIINNELLTISSGIDLFDKINLAKFYKEQAKVILKQRTHMYAANTNIEINSVKTGSYRSCWGRCCAYTKSISLNISLIYAPVSTIDSVICHELAHIKYANHSKDFYNYLTTIYPTYYEDHIWLNYFMPLL